MSPASADEFHWERFADEWIAWVRTPEHDAFWAYLDEFREFLPVPGRATLDLGCGEGRVARQLTALGHTVTATDLSPSLLAAAERADSAVEYRLADAAALPFADDSFDRVVTYNVLMDVPDLDAVVSEAARVLEPGGVLTVSVVHPFADTGSFTEAGTFEWTHDYFDTRPFDEVQTERGLDMHWYGWARPLREYTRALRAAGLAVTDLHEPRPGRYEGPYRGLARWRRVPLFLWLNAVHRD